MAGWGFLRRPRAAIRRMARWFGKFLPKGLFARALIIIIAPMVILQSVLAYAFMERHWQTVTRRLSAAVTQDIAALIDVAESYPQDANFETLERIAGDRLGLDVEMLPPGPLPTRFAMIPNRFVPHPGAVTAEWIRDHTVDRIHWDYWLPRLQPGRIVRKIRNMLGPPSNSI